MDEKQADKHACALCKDDIPDPSKHPIDTLYDFSKHEYTDEPICDACSEDQNDSFGDELAGDIW